jgi:peptidoglycan/xylan/chitin deacetylase (PgdA/CDA1 family)
MSAPLTRDAAIECNGAPASAAARSVFALADGVRGRWRPAPALKATAVLHLGGALALSASASAWPWVAGTLIANHGILLASSMTPRSQMLGPNRVRLPASAVRRGEVALTFDDGPDAEVTPRVLDLLDRFGATASFFCIGKQAAALPHLTREIVARGHSVESHSQQHSPAFASYGPWRLRRELEAAQQSIADASGLAPVFFRAPFGTRNPMLDPTLTRLGLSYVSWTRRGLDRVDGHAPRVLRRLTKGLDAGDVLLLHDRVPAGDRAREATVLSVLPRLLERLAERDLKAVSLRSACGDELAA